MRLLVTGGAGYIGSHTCLELLQSGHSVVVLDNFSNGHREALRRVEQLAGKSLDVVQGDIQDTELVRDTLRNFECEGVFHFAGLKAVGDSVADPLSFYTNNVFGTISLLEAMKSCGVKTLVFSSSATVYGDPRWLPITENHPLRAKNPYGRTKLVIEDVLRDLHKSDPTWSIGLLRYFNPVGAHESGLLGEDPKGVPTNLMPFVSQVASGRREALSIWGRDYPTPDGTGARDYIHVVDLAQGHLAALNAMNEPKLFEVNLGTGQSYSVLEVIAAFEAASGRPIGHEFQERRPGDVAACYADPQHAKAFLGWAAQKGLHEMCADHWRWEVNNPNGYNAAH